MNNDGKNRQIDYENYLPVAQAYLIFVISFTQAKFSKNEIYTENRVNYKKWISRQNSVNQDLFEQAMKKVCKTIH